MNISRKNISLFALLIAVVFSATTHNVLAANVRRSVVPVVIGTGVVIGAGAAAYKAYKYMSAKESADKSEEKKKQDEKKAKEEKQKQDKDKKEKRTFKQTWSKVIRLKWSELDKKDAWNMFLTSAATGGVVGGSYLAYRAAYVSPAQRAEQERLRQQQERLIQQQERESQEREQERIRRERFTVLWGPNYNPNQDETLEIHQDFLNRVIDDNGNPIQPIDRFGNILDRDDARAPIPCVLNAHDVCEMDIPDDEDFREPGFMPTVRNRLLCGHFDFCRTCLKAHIRVAVHDNNGAQISCPHQDCNHQISPQEIRNLAQIQEDNDLIELANHRAINPRTRAMRLLQGAGHNWNLRACHECYNTFQYNGEQIIRCQNCNNSYCARCRSNDCDATNIRHNNGVNAIRCANPDRLVAKRCPRCGDVGAADDACNHTTCPQCSYQFCWMCLGPYRAGGAGCGSFHCETLQMRR